MQVNGSLLTPFQFDMALQRPVFAMYRRGIKVDLAKRAELSELAQQEWDRHQLNLNKVAGTEVNVNSPKQMQWLFYKELGLPVRRKNDQGKSKITTDEDALRSLMAFTNDKISKLVQEDAKYRWIRCLLALKLTLKIRGIRKLKSSYYDVDIDRDDRARTEIAVGGTETMRFSHSKTAWDTGLNLATVPHKVRRVFIADDGYELAEFDLNRGESWVYTFLSMDPELLRIHLSGGDFHSETASAIQSAFGGAGMTPQEIAKLAKSGDEFGYRIRYLGKKVNHASAYRMGPFRAAEVINEEEDDTGITVMPGQMKKAQALWRRKYMGVEGTWWNGIDRELENNRRLVTPYGRVRDFYGFMNDHLKKEATAHVPQSTSVDYLNIGMLRVYNELVSKKAYGLELLHQNHDSILVQYPIEYRDEVIPEVITRLTSSVIINGEKVSIPVEGMHGQNWGDWHKDRNPEGLQEWRAAA